MKLSLKPLDRQVVVVTGATSGIGLVTARTAARRGARVVLVARGEDALETAVCEIVAEGGIAGHAVADVGDAAQVEGAARAAVARFGRIDSWINVAGVAIYAKLMATPLDEHERLFRTNYFGVVNGATAAVPRLLRQGGALITVASIAADMPSPILGAYAASKHAVRGYIEALRMELQADGAPISVTLVKPAGIDTPLGHHAANHEGGAAQIPASTPYDPQLVADAILDAAVHPRRTVTVGGAGRAQALFAALLPMVFDRIAPKVAQGFIDHDKVQQTPSNLFAAGRGGDERSGELSARTTSVYTAAERYPRLMTVAAASGLVAGIAVLRHRTRKAS